MKSVVGYCLILLLSSATATAALLEEQDVTTPINYLDHPMIRRGLKKSKFASVSGCIQIKDGDYSASASVDVTGICNCEAVVAALEKIICKDEFSIDTCDADSGNSSCHTTSVSILAEDIDKKDAKKKISVDSIEKGLQNNFGSQIEIRINKYFVWKN